MPRHFFAPDVPQLSDMDTGVAALKCVLDGFDLPVNPRHLQQILQPNMVVTTLDRLQVAARTLGLAVESSIVPIDHLLLPIVEIEPAILAARQPDGSNHPHFIVVWRRHGPFFQVMDPAVGLRLLTSPHLLDELEICSRPIPAQEWRGWATACGFSDLLRHRLTILKVNKALAARLVDKALGDPGWRSLAALDAATRAVDAGVRAGGWQGGDQAGRMIEQLFEHAQSATWDDSLPADVSIPRQYWSVLPQPPLEGDQPEEQLFVRGVECLRVRRLPTSQVSQPSAAEKKDARALPHPRKPDLERDPQLRAERELVRALRADGLLTPTFVISGLAIAAVAVSLEALLLQGMMKLGSSLPQMYRVGVLAGLIVFFCAVMLLEFPINAALLRMGRRLEARLRISLLEKISRLSNRYFLDRPIADLNRRAYALRELREAPIIGAKLLRASFQLVLTSAFIIWLEPINTPLILIDIIFVFSILRVANPFMGTSIFRCFIHAITLNHFYLDSLLGLVPARTHSAERSIRREHEGTLVDLVHADSRLSGRFGVFFFAVALIPAVITIWMIFNYVARGGDASNLLLLTYWVLNIPMLTERIGSATVQYLQHCRPAALTLAQVLDAPEETEGNHAGSTMTATRSEPTEAVSLTLEDVSVQVGDSKILSNISLTIQPGEQIAVVGASGAGKSSLVGLVLGWHRPTTGQILVEGEPLEGERLRLLRQETAWVDTGVQLWNRSLLDNLHYGTLPPSTTPIGQTIEEADLYNVLATLPNGLQTLLGESGRLVSGGEGQRVRLGRALFRPGVRLVILDEPFRALDRTSRRQLLAQARLHWQGATLILISHDVSDVQGFGRVLVMEGGRIIEDGVPSALAAQPASRYCALLEAEQAAHQALWGSTEWRRLWLGNGQLSEANGNGPH